MVSLLFSKFMITIGMIGLLALALFDKNIKHTFQQYVHAPAFLAITGVFFIYLLSGIYSDDLGYFGDRMRIKLPFLILPFAFVGFPKLSERTYHSLLLFFFYFMSIICISLSANYFLQYEHFNQLYKEGQIMPTPIQHIRFSLLVVVAIAIGVYLSLKKMVIRYDWEKGVLIGLSAFLVLFLHLLAVRSGLVALYSLFLLYVVYFIFYYKKYALAAGLLVGGILMATIAVTSVPTIKNKVGYMRYSIDLFLKNENIRELSDSRRLGSIQAGIAIGKENPILGTGVGDIRKDSNDYLKNNYPELADLGLLPHNQYVFVFAATGFVGLLLFLFCTIYPFFPNKAFTDLFFCSVQVIYFSSFLSEHTLEAQIGTASYIFFLLLSLIHHREPRGTQRLDGE